MENVCEGRAEGFIADPDELAFGASWIEEGADEVKDATMALSCEVLADLGYGFEGGVVIRREEEADSGRFNAMTKMFWR